MRYLSCYPDNGQLALLGVGKITAKKVSKPLHSPAYTYHIYSRQALVLLEAIVPYLKTYKQHRGRLAMEQYQIYTPRNGKYSAEMLVRREKFVQSFFSIKPHSIIDN